MSLNKPKITMAYLDHLYGGMNMQPVFKTLEELKVVGLGTKFISILSPDHNNHILIPKLWDEYLMRAKEIDGRKGENSFGICLELSKSDQTHPNECYYMAAAAVETGSKVPEGMEKRVIPAGEYAVFTHKGGLDKLSHTMQYIYGSWLPKSDRKLRVAPDLEIYDERFDPNSDSSELDLYIPVE
jgi:AraC family transcriptional regulator